MQITERMPSSYAQEENRRTGLIKAAGAEAGFGGMNGTFAQSNMSIRAQALQSIANDAANAPGPRPGEKPWQTAARVNQGKTLAETAQINQGLRGGQSFDQGPYGHAAMNAAQQAREAERVAREAQTQGQQTQQRGGPQRQPIQGLQPTPQLDMFKAAPATAPSFLEQMEGPSILGGQKQRGMRGGYKPQGMFSGSSSGMPSSLPESNSMLGDTFEDELKPVLQFNFGTEEVVDPTGNGSPTQDTVHAKLAEGEAVLNAAAMDVPGRKELVAKWNKEGAKKMGLRGGPQMKDGVLHAAVGFSGIDLPDDDPYPGKTAAKKANRTPRINAADVAARVGSVEQQMAQNVAAEKAQTLRNAMGPKVVGSYDARAGLTPGAGANQAWDDELRKSRNIMANERIAAENARLAAAAQAKAAAAQAKAAAGAVPPVGPAASVAQNADDYMSMKQRLQSAARGPLRDAFGAAKGVAPTLKGLAKGSLAALGPALTGADMVDSSMVNADFYNDPNVGEFDKFKQRARDYGQPLIALGTTAAGAGVGTLGLGVGALPGGIAGAAVGGGINALIDDQGAALQEYRKTNRAQEGLYDKMFGGRGQAAPGQASSSKQAPIQPAFVEATPSQMAPQDQAAQQRTLRDNAGFSEFFNKAGITDAQREAAPAYNQGQYKGGLARMKLDNSTDQIYRQGNTYTGMGAPSRIEAEIAKANDPAVQKAALMQRLEQQALAGSKEAAAMFQQIVQSDAAIEGERMRGASGLEAAKVTAGAKAAGGKDKGGASLNDLLKLGTTLIGEGREAELLQAVNQRKQVAVDQLIKAGKVDAAKEVQAAEADQDFIIETANLMRQREAGAENSQGSRAAAGGVIGAGLGAAAGLGLGILTKKPKLVRAGAYGLGGALGLGGYGYATGSQGVDEFTDLNRIAALESNNGDLVGGGITIPGQFLTDDQKVLRGLRQ